jgi:hypothetical protein
MACSCSPYRHVGLYYLKLLGAFLDPWGLDLGVSEGLGGAKLRTALLHSSLWPGHTSGPGVREGACPRYAGVSSLARGAADGLGRSGRSSLGYFRVRQAGEVSKVNVTLVYYS